MSAGEEEIAAGGDSAKAPYLASLSQEQYGAVTANPDVPLQILAGPGSGKTRVLVARVAWLILTHNIRPNDLVVVTFTNKAASEMRQRLVKLIGPERTASLILGTFHATCARYLRKGARAVGLNNNFSICDADEAKKIIKVILKDKRAELEGMGLPSTLKVEQVMSEISKAKAKDLDPEEYMSYLHQISAGKGADGGRRVERTEVRRAAAEVYVHYQTHLKANNAVDFDDLLVYGVRLFRDNPEVIGNVRHVLVDEFQDTNAVQYSLMSELAGANGARHSVSIVGDPDQSIYGWRSAEVGNLGLMKQDFGGKRVKDGQHSEGVEQVFLEENYRSTGHILKAAKGIIESDSDRIDRGLYTSHPVGAPVVLKQHASSQHEANFVALEVKRLVAHSGGLFDYDDFAILLRYNAMSREVERQLQSENIPSRMMGGARFFERKEVKDILAYLTLADNPLFTPALERVINVPKRSIGDKALDDLKQLAQERGVRTMEIVEEAANSEKPVRGVKPGVQKSLRSFVDVVREIRQMADSHTPVSTIIETLLKRIRYEDYLKKEDDYAQRWENVKELINFSILVSQAGMAIPYEPPQEEDEDEVDDDGMAYEEEGGDVSWGTLSSTANGTARSVASSATMSSTVKSESGRSEKARGKHKPAESEVIDLASSDEDEKPARKRAKARVERAERSPKEETGRATAGKTKDRRGAVKGLERDDDKDEAPSSLTDDGEVTKSPLRIFLEASTLSTDMEQDDGDGKSPKVTIATTHAAKGLEFPVVFILAVESGTFPFFRCTTSEEINEECRLLYVAATRAQTHLYLNYCSTRMSYGESRVQTLSPFLARISDATKFRGGSWTSSATAPVAGGFMGPGSSSSHGGSKKASKVDFASTRPHVGTEERRVIARVLDRKAVDEGTAAELVERFERSDVGARSQALDAVAGSGSFFSTHTGPPTTSSFTSARSLVGPRLTPIGVSTTFNSTAKYDRDGWATGRATARPGANDRGGHGVRPKPADRYPHSSSSSFMDEYRLSKNQHAHEGMTMNSLLGKNRARTGVDAFQSSNQEALKGFMNMLPGDGSPSAPAPSSSSSSGGNTNITKGANASSGTKVERKKRLGMGRARKE